MLKLMNFYPRPPQGGRLEALDAVELLFDISIHALRKEGDLPRSLRGRYAGDISIHALRKEGDVGVARLGDRLIISIHALRKEGDGRRCRRSPIGRYFYPRPPQGGRQIRSYQATLGQQISIHALRKEGDFSSVSFAATFCLFLSTPSARRAT